LNLGHTLAHALESVSLDNSLTEPRATISHGEAVALGLCYSAILSQKIVSMSKQEVSDIWQALSASKCLLSIETLNGYLSLADRDQLKSPILWKHIFKKMIQDKKKQSSTSETIDFVVLDKIGAVHQSEEGYLTPISSCLAKEAWDELIVKLGSYMDLR
jgi:3-dehydroquinate synthetase